MSLQKKMSANKKYNGKQEEAIKKLLINLDELDNKPRRLYEALENLAVAFGKIDSIPSIREAQDVMYTRINRGDQYVDLFNSLREFTIDEWRRQVEDPGLCDVSASEERISGARDFVKKHISMLNECQ